MFKNIMFHDIILFLFKNTTFQRLDSVIVFRWNLLCCAQSVELVPVSRPKQDDG
jgi:hypothetical protein